MYPKIHHASTPNSYAILDLDHGWRELWRDIGVFVVGWGWLQGDPTIEAELAVDLCRRYDLDGYIANAESPYEFDGAWKNEVFVSRFRELAPRAPLALSYIGEGYPYRMLNFTPWVNAGAALMPQCYWGNSATTPGNSYAAALRADLPLDRLVYTLGTSAFANPYPAEQYKADLTSLEARNYNVWLLESTTDDYLRALQ